MKFFLQLSRLIDALNLRIGCAVTWLTLAVVLVSATNAVVRKVFNISSNAWLELQWYLFGAIFLLAAGYTFLKNEHVRVDVLSQRFAPRTQAKIEIFGIIFFLLPACLLVFWLSLPYFWQSLILKEASSNTGGLIRWPVKLLIPVGFALLILAASAPLIKSNDFFRVPGHDPVARLEERAPEEELAEEIRQKALAEEAARLARKNYTDTVNTEEEPRNAVHCW